MPTLASARIVPLALALALAGCRASQGAPALAFEAAAAPAAALPVLVFGDQGSGKKDGQYAVAKTMAEVCAKLGCGHDALVMGDNFYGDGVKSADDPQFQEKFEIPYAPLTSAGMVFHPVLGNHDYGGSWLHNPFRLNGNVQAQIDYTRKSKSWRLPARYYQFSAGAVDFFAIDTNATNDRVAFDAAQAAWLEAALKASKARWRVVYGHHPIFSAGEHGDTKALKSSLLPLLCAKADLYLAGHEHDLQLLETQPEDCPGADRKAPLVLVISGGGGKKPRPVDKAHPRKVYYHGGLGFNRLLLGDSGFQVIAYDGTDGHVVFEKAYVAPPPGRSPGVIAQ